MVTRSVVQSAMHTAATALVHLPPGEWAGWVVYLCETLELTSRDQEGDRDAVLEDIITRLRERLERGSW